MGSLHGSAASIGFYGDDLDPREITEALGGAPTVGVRKGDVWRTEAGAAKIARTGSWRIKAVRCASGDLNGQISAVLNGLTDDLEKWRLFAARFDARAFCGLFLAQGNEGVTLQPTTLARLGERGLRLDLDIYGPDTSD